MHIQKKNAFLKKKGSCTVWEYGIGKKDLGIAQAKINGRYPEKGKAINVDCDLVYFIADGSGIIHTQQGSYTLQKDDIFFIKKGNWYWVEGANLTVILPSTPAWFPEQYREDE